VRAGGGPGASRPDRPRGLACVDLPSAAGSDRHACAIARAAGREAPADRYTQPVCAIADELVRRQRLPLPQALRIAVGLAPTRSRGAAAVVTAHRPRSILVLVRDL
jgi:hypothetical protein